MEDRLRGSGEDYSILRPSHLTDGESTKVIRVGIEDAVTGTESKAIGYTISREDAGRWTAENLFSGRNPKFVNKIVSITY